MRTETEFYSYNYLYKISDSPAFIKKMILLFINSITEYRNELITLLQTKNFVEFQRVIHKLKPSALSMDVKGVKEIIHKYETLSTWTDEVPLLIQQLIDIFTKIKPMMEKDLEAIAS